VGQRRFLVGWSGYRTELVREQYTTKLVGEGDVGAGNGVKGWLNGEEKGWEWGVPHFDNAQCPTSTP
jgi:hypothetical protein